MPPDSLHEVEAVLDGDAESLLIYRDASGDGIATLEPRQRVAGFVASVAVFIAVI